MKREFDPIKMFVEARKAQARKSPKPGELIQGIFFAWLTAIEYLKGADLLLENKMVVPAYAQLISSIEELGKINRLADVLVSLNPGDKIGEFVRSQKNHPWKIAGAFRIFRSVLTAEGTKLTIKGVKGLENLEEKESVEALLGLVSDEAASHYHELRLKVAYTNFDGQRATSPFNREALIDPDACRILITLFRGTSEKLLDLATRLLPIYVNLLTEAFREGDPDRLTEVKREINRRVSRSRPAFYLYLDRWLQKNRGMHVDEFMELSDEEVKKAFEEIGSLPDHARAISSLIISNEEIPEMYFYPPLKDWAVEYYKKLSEQI